MIVTLSTLRKEPINQSVVKSGVIDDVVNDPPAGCSPASQTATGVLLLSTPVYEAEIADIFVDEVRSTEMVLLPVAGLNK